MNHEDTGAPIFIVGASRSGTALVRAVLSQHPNIYISGETHYFDDLRVKLGRLSREGLNPGTRRSCEDYFLALSHRPYGHKGDPERSEISRDELSDVASRLGGVGDNYFEAFCIIWSTRHGKQRWGEKTPRHIYRVAEILERYPGAKVVCTMRDPRAVVSSYKNWKQQGGFDFERDPGHRDAIKEAERRSKRSYHVITASLMWRSAATAAQDAVKRFGDERVRIVKYEDLVERSGETAKSLCEWLGEEFTEDMLNVPVHNSSFMTYAEKSGIVGGSLDRWKQGLTKAEVGVVEWYCADIMDAWDYPRTSPHAMWGSIIAAYATWPFRIASAFFANRDRMGNIYDYITRRLRFARMR